MELFKEVEVWVGIGLVLFFLVLIYFKAPHAAARALDERSAKIKTTLEEAQQLRDEAAATLASLKAKRQEAERQAGQMLVEAEAEARRLEAEAKTRLDEQIARRSALADRRIALAETQALTEVKTAAADMAARAAESLLAARLTGATSDPLLDRAIGQIGERLQ